MEADLPTIEPEASLKTLRYRPTEGRNATVGCECRIGFFPADSPVRSWSGIMKG